MRALWRARVGNSAVSYLLIADDADTNGNVLELGPRTVQEPIRSVDCAGLAAVLEEAAPMAALDAVRHIVGEVVRLAGRGMVVHGLLTVHTLESRLHDDPGFRVFAAETLDGLRIDGDWRSVLRKVGYDIERLEPRGYLARFEGRPVVVVHPKADPRDFMRLDDAGRPAEGVLAAELPRPAGPATAFSPLAIAIACLIVMYRPRPRSGWIWTPSCWASLAAPTSPCSPPDTWREEA